MECLGLMIKKSVKEGLDFLKRHRKFLPYPIQDLTVIMTLCRILDALFEFMQIKRGTAKSEFSLSHTDEIMSPLFSGSLSLPSRFYERKVKARRV